MNSDSTCCTRATLNWVGVLAVFLAMAVLVSALKHYTQLPPVNQARAAERYKILADTRQKVREELDLPAWLDREKGLVRLPTGVAMSLAIQQWQDPAGARAELLKRADKAFFIPPPPPETPSDFE